MVLLPSTARFAGKTITAPARLFNQCT